MDFSHANNGVFCLSEGGRDAWQSRSENIDSRIMVINADSNLLGDPRRLRQLDCPQTATNVGVFRRYGRGEYVSSS